MTDDTKTILIVDDNLALARVIQFAMEEAGFDTVTAKNARIAYELAQQTKFDLVITDQQMPEMTGLELCGHLREMPEYADCPINLLTAKGLELELPRLQKEFGINAVFSKPFSPSALVKTILDQMAIPVS